MAQFLRADPHYPNLSLIYSEFTVGLRQSNGEAVTHPVGERERESCSRGRKRRVGEGIDISTGGNALLLLLLWPSALTAVPEKLRSKT